MSIDFHGADASLMNACVSTSSCVLNVHVSDHSTSLLILCRGIL